MRLVTLKNFVKKSSGLDRFLFFIILIGVIVTGVSLFRGILIDRKVQVEYLSGERSNTDEAKKKIFVDVEGAVINSGVFELSEGLRIKDALVLAGGLSDKADRDFCEKNINMAEVMKDGQKIYIPSVGKEDAPVGYVEAKSTSKKVNVNSATVAELDTLWGIGSARAETIVKNRPYQSVDDLVTKGVLTKSLLEKNIDLLSVY